MKLVSFINSMKKPSRLFLKNSKLSYTKSRINTK